MPTDNKNKIPTHPVYDAHVGQWQELRALHDAKDVALNFLHQHVTESDEAFRMRQERADEGYRNFCAFVTSVYASNIWSMPPRRSLPKAVEPYLHDMDRRSTEADVFFKEVSISAMVEGVAHVLVDLPFIPPESLKGKPLTKALERELNIRPYCTLIRPQQIVNWSIETKDAMRLGELNWVVIRYDGHNAPTSPFDEPEDLVQYVIWYTDHWERWEETKDKTGEVRLIKVSEGTHPFGVVPLVQFYDKRSMTDMVGTSSIRDIAPLTVGLLNKMSLLDEAERWSAIPYLVIYSRVAALESLRLDRHRAIKLAPEDRMEYVAPANNIMESIRQSCYDIIKDIVQIAIHQIEPSTQTGESTDKVRIDRHEFISSLKEKATNFEDAEKTVWQLMLRGTVGKKSSGEADINITYNKRFIHETVSEQLKAALDIRDLSIPSPTFQKMYLSNLAHLALDGATEDELGTIANELEENLKKTFAEGDFQLEQAKELVNQAMSLVKIREMQKNNKGMG